MIVDELDDETIAARLAALETGMELPEYKTEKPSEIFDVRPQTETATNNRFVRPLAQAAEEWIEVTQNTEGRWMLGLPEIDAMTRGFGKGELALITGFSHSSKTQVYLSSLVRAPERPSLLITPDESEVLVLSKLVGMMRRLNGEELERGIKANDPATLNMVRRCAAEDLKKVIVTENAYTIDDFTTAVAEATEYFGEPPHVVAIDYLEMIQGADLPDVEAKAQALKAWTKKQPFPVVCIHQASRGKGARGQKLTIDSGKYGGESEANFIIGVRRPADDPESGLEPNDPEVRVSCIKNKRPPSRKGERSFFMDTSCGFIDTAITVGAPNAPRPTMIPR